MADRARVAVLISGRGSNMLALAEAAAGADCPFEITLVLADNALAPGIALAEARGIPAAVVPAAGSKRVDHEAQVSAALRAAGAEWVALAGYMRLLSPAFVAEWAGRIVNIHPSLLPAHKGLDTHARALTAGDERHGCTVHIVTEGLDDGPILAQAGVPVLPADTAETLAARVLVEEHRLYPATLAALVTKEAA